jgi:hypothetical protein
VQAADSIVVNRSAWQETYERAFDEALRELVAAAVPPDEAIDALRDAFTQGRDDGEDECTVSWLIAAASGIWRRRRWRERLLGPLAHGREAPAQRARHGPLPHASTRGRDRVAAVIAGTGLAVPLLVVAVMVADPRSAVVEQPSAPLPIASPAAPTATPISGARPEAEAWGAVWSLSPGVPVLRPEWLPEVAGRARAVLYGVLTQGECIPGYRVEYHDLPVRATAGSTVPSIWVAVGPTRVQCSLLHLGGGAGETVTLRGRPGELHGNGRPGWQVVWSERGYRYAVQAFGFSREDVLRIAESLAPVIDDSGRTRVDNLVPFVTPERW